MSPDGRWRSIWRQAASDDDQEVEMLLEKKNAIVYGASGWVVR